MTVLLAALMLAAPMSPRVFAHQVPWHPPSHARPDRTWDLAGGELGSVRVAQAAGVEGFTIDLVLGDPEGCLRVMRGWLTTAERAGGGFVVGPCLDTGPSADPAFWAKVLLGWDEMARGSAAAMRHDGRLVAFTYNSPKLSADAWREVKRLCQAGGADPFVVGDVEGPLRQGPAGEATVRAQAAVLDGCYTFASYPEGQARLAAILAGTGHERPVIGAPSPGYWRTNTGALNRPFEGTKAYDESWQTVYANHCDWAVITTWNDYGETTHIEPSRNNADLIARLTAVYAARLRGQDLAKAAGAETFYLTAPPELPDGPGRGPLEANPRRENLFELTRIGPPTGPLRGTVTITTAAGLPIEERQLDLSASDPISAARFAWDVPRTVGATFLRVRARVGGVSAELPLPLWPREVAHRFVMSPLRARLVADLPDAPVVMLAEGRLAVTPIEPAVGRVDLLHDYQQMPDPKSTTAGVAVGAAQLPPGEPGWGFWSAAYLRPDGAVRWSDPLWLPPQGDLLCLARYSFESGGDDSSPYARRARVVGTAEQPWQAELADGSHALRCGEQSWAEPPGSFLPSAGPLTISFWCRPDAPGGMLFGDVGAPMLLSLEGLQPRVARHGADGAWVGVTAPEPLELRRWSHVAGVYDGAQLLLYVNGKPVAHIAAGPASGSERQALGRNPFGGNARFVGLLDEVEIRGDAFTAAKAAALVMPAEPK